MDWFQSIHLLLLLTSSTVTKAIGDNNGNFTTVSWSQCHYSYLNIPAFTGEARTGRQEYRSTAEVVG